jgi:hypothetical protein
VAVKKLELVKTRGTSPEATVNGPAIARVTDIREPGFLQVTLADQSICDARMVAELNVLSPECLVGQEVVVIFENNDPSKPIAMALLQQPDSFASALAKASQSKPELDVRVDGEHIVIEAQKKLELRVGKASIIINEEGKITVRGAHLLNRSSGPIRIKGGHVDIN